MFKKTLVIAAVAAPAASALRIRGFVPSCWVGSAALWVGLIRLASAI